MKTQPEEKPASGGTGASAGGELARILAVLGINLILVLVAVVFASTERGKLPDLNFQTLLVGVLPVSAAMGLMLGCRRLDLALPALAALMIALRGNSHILPGDDWTRLGILCCVAAALGLLNSLVTWIGRVASAFWTALVALVLLVLAQQAAVPLLATSGTWPWPVALAASLSALVVGGVLMGVTGMVALPTTPPIVRTGARGLSGLIGAWMIAGIALALAAQSETAKSMADPLTAYPPMLAAGALGGAYILRGRWGAVVAVALTCVGHLAWSFAVSTDLGDPLLDALVPVAVPVVAVPLYLLVDRAIRASTSESAPTGLLA